MHPGLIRVQSAHEKDNSIVEVHSPTVAQSQLQVTALSNSICIDCLICLLLMVQYTLEIDESLSVLKQFLTVY